MKNKINILFLIIAFGSTRCSNGDEKSKNDPNNISEEYYTKVTDCNCKELDVRRNDNGTALKSESKVYYNIKTGDLFNGSCEEKHGNGKRKLFVEFQDGLQNGKVVSWYEDGQLEEIINFSNGSKNGEHKKWKEGNEDKLLKLAYYKNGEYIDKGFYYEKGILESVWYIIPDKSVGSAENHASFILRNHGNLDVDKAKGVYDLIFHDKVSDEILISYFKEILETHFSQEGKEKTKLPVLFEITFYFEILKQEKHGYKEQDLEAAAKAKERKRLADLFVKEFPQLFPELVASEENNTNDSPNEIPTSEKLDAPVLLKGTWEGEMSGKKLTIVIETVDANKITGYNVLGTTKRALTGTYEEYSGTREDQVSAGGFKLMLKEPGDNKWDGVFTIDVNESFPTTGTWKANNGGKTSEFMLEKK